MLDLLTNLGHKGLNRHKGKVLTNMGHKGLNYLGV